MTFVLSFFVVLSLFPVLSAIQCYNGAQGVYVNNPKTLPTVDCGGGVSTCSKTVDLVGQIATRSCGPGTTCTYAGAQSNKGYCYNVSTSQTQCCCYGNLCNDSVRAGVNIGYLIIPLLILFGFQSRKFIF
ncbi:unnamed protein product [Bursaphelenchus xylophilus]|nr:unnamed protein product [Bursaphelenchus xylophilus]CAG9125921.1 unnamed protein product [Bursaphelenchus xylophilus]